MKHWRETIETRRVGQVKLIFIFDRPWWALFLWCRQRTYVASNEGWQVPVGAGCYRYRLPGWDLRVRIARHDDDQKTNLPLSLSEG